MVKNAIIPVAVFAIVLIGSTLFRVKTAPTPAPIVNADSVAQEVVHAPVLDTAVVEEPVHASVAHAAPPPPVPVAAPIDHAEPEADPGTDVAATDDAYRSLARIFAQMKAEEAAAVFALMSDNEVENLLRNLGARTAAAVLTSMTPRRAAALAQRLLVPVAQANHE